MRLYFDRKHEHFFLNMFDLFPSSSCLQYFADHHVLVHSIQALAMTVSHIYCSAFRDSTLLPSTVVLSPFKHLIISLMHIILQQQDALII